MKWVEKYVITGTTGNVYIVSKSDQGVWGCSCPNWKFRRQECKHIRAIIGNMDHPRFKPTFEGKEAESVKARQLVLPKGKRAISFDGI